MVTEYPTITTEIKNELMAMEMCPTHFRVKNSADPTEEYNQQGTDLQSKDALLTDDKYKEAGKVKQKDYFGPDYNKGFLQDLAKASKARKKELGQKDIKSEASASGPDYGSDGAKSPVGSHQNKIPDPYKG